MIVKQIIEFGRGCALTKRARTSGRKFTTFDHCVLCTLYMLDVVIIMPHTHPRVAPQAGHSALCGVGLVLEM